MVLQHSRKADSGEGMLVGSLTTPKGRIVLNRNLNPAFQGNTLTQHENTCCCSSLSPQHTFLLAFALQSHISVHMETVSQPSVTFGY